jgi:transcriptional regulator with XRE-family HTH domain
MTLKKVIGANIRAARKAAAMSQPQLAKELGIDATRISGYENGHVKPGDERIRKIAEITGAPSLGWFYDEHSENGSS